MNFDFGNKTVIVTGGTGALGVSIVNAFINANAKVIATYRDEQQAKSFWLNVPDSKNKVSLVKCELTDQQDIDNLLVKASSLGQLRALINAAGGYRYGLIEETEEPAAVDTNEVDTEAKEEENPVEISRVISGAISGISLSLPT